MPAVRRLTAIMFTDTVGSTTTAQANETLALRLRDEQHELVRPVFSSHGGREVKSMGDGFLVEFSSALRAVECAIDIQRRIHQRNSQKGRPFIELRIGIHLGDVEERGSDIVGDSVNVASRLEPLADPGGICISEPVFGQVRNKIPNQFQKLDSPRLKNVQFPLDVYQVILSSTEGPAVTRTLDMTRVAVLPFSNISPDPNDAYFADGLTEEVISELSRNIGLRVIARTSVMRYRDAPKSVKDIGRELQVGVVLEGSVRKAGNRIRITAQLIDSASEEHLWSERFDRDFTDIFEIQSEIAKNVAAALGVRLAGVQVRGRPPTRNLDAYSQYLKGRSLWNQRSTESVYRALGEFEQAASKDPSFAQAYSGIADCYSILTDRSEMAWSEARPKAMAAALKAVELSPELAEPHASLGLIFHTGAQWESAEREFRRAIELAPGYASAHQWYFLLLVATGRLEEAGTELTRATEADPLAPIIIANAAQFAAFHGRDLDAVKLWDQAIELAPGLRDWFLFSKTAFYARRGRREEAEASLRDLASLLEKNGTPSELDRIWMLATLQAMLGRPEQAHTALELLPPLLDQGRVTPLEIASVYAGLGDIDHCYEWLYHSIEALYVNIYNVRLHPLYDGVRADHRFAELLRACRVQS